MHRSDYRSALGKLFIENPTEEDMARLCPHLTKKQAVDELTKGTGYVACPPLYVQGAFQILKYQKEWVEKIFSWHEGVQTITEIKKHPPKLSMQYSGRSSSKSNYKYTNEAIQFAKDNWGNDLVMDNWMSVVKTYIEDPADLINGLYPRVKGFLYVALNRSFNEIINDHSKPKSELFDEAISQITLDPAVWREIQGERGVFEMSNCAHCGASLMLSSCPVCKHIFRDDQFRATWNIPLTHKMSTFLHMHGHKFTTDPGIAREKERDAFNVR